MRTNWVIKYFIRGTALGFAVLRPNNKQAPVQFVQNLELKMSQIFKNIGGSISEMLLANQANYRKLTQTGVRSAVWKKVPG